MALYHGLVISQKSIALSSCDLSETRMSAKNSSLLQWLSPFSYHLCIRIGQKFIFFQFPPTAVSFTTSSLWSSPREPQVYGHTVESRNDMTCWPTGIYRIGYPKHGLVFSYKSMPEGLLVINDPLAKSCYSFLNLRTGWPLSIFRGSCLRMPPCDPWGLQKNFCSRFQGIAWRHTVDGVLQLRRPDYGTT